MKKKNPLLISVLTMIVMALMLVPVSAKDAADYPEDSKTIQVNKMYTHTFEKKGDTDCFRFVSGGGKYKVEVYDLSGRPLESYGEIIYGDFFMNFTGIQTSYGQFEKFSPAAGDPPDFYMGETYTEYFCPTKKGSTYEMMQTVNIGSYKKGKTVGVMFEGDYKGDYKFKVIGNAAPKSAQKKLTAKNTKISVKKSVNYNGKAQTPAVTVKYKGKKLKKGTDYTVSYSNNTKPGKAKVKVKGTGNYTGTLTTTFKIKK